MATKNNKFIQLNILLLPLLYTSSYSYLIFIPLGVIIFDFLINNGIKKLEKFHFWYLFLSLLALNIRFTIEFMVVILLSITLKKFKISPKVWFYFSGLFSLFCIFLLIKGTSGFFYTTNSIGISLLGLLFLNPVEKWYENKKHILIILLLFISIVLSNNRFSVFIAFLLILSQVKFSLKRIFIISSILTVSFFYGLFNKLTEKFNRDDKINDGNRIVLFQSAISSVKLFEKSETYDFEDEFSHNYYLHNSLKFGLFPALFYFLFLFRIIKYDNNNYKIFLVFLTGMTEGIFLKGTWLSLFINQKNK